MSARRHLKFYLKVLRISHLPNFISEPPRFSTSSPSHLLLLRSPRLCVSALSLLFFHNSPTRALLYFPIYVI